MDLDKRIAELIAENERLREALSPFAEVGGIYSRGHQSIPDENTTMICITVGELRRAYQVIHPTDGRADLTHVQTDDE